MNVERVTPFMLMHAVTETQRQEAQMGVAWFNNCSELERLYWLKRANSSVPADAYAAFRAEPLTPNYCSTCTPAGHACYCKTASDE